MFGKQKSSPGSIQKSVKHLLSILSWKTLKDLKNQPLKVKIFTSFLALTLLANLTGIISLVKILSLENSNYLGIGLIALNLLLLTLVALYFTRFIFKTVIDPIQVLIKEADRVAAGDFTVELTKTYDDDVGDLVDKYNTFLDSLREMMGMLSGEQATAYMAAEENAEAKRYIDRKVQEILAVMEKVAVGDLTQHLTIENEDEIGNLYKGFNTVILNLNEILETVMQSVDQVKNSSDAIKHATVQLGTETTQQANSTTLMLERVEFLSATAQSILLTSEQTREIVQEGINITSSAEKEVGKTVDIMLEIAQNAKESAGLISGLNESSEKIGEIVSLIKEIANQTNLLALNAAIEAARAGAHGKGFAVVAEEVKKLAERTTISTTEISERIATIQEQTAEVTSSIEAGLKKIQSGTLIAEEAQNSLEKVVESTEMGVQMVLQIDSSSEMQCESTKDIANTIKDMVSSIKTSEHQASDITNAVSALSNLTEALKSALGQFNLKNYKASAPQQNTNPELTQVTPSFEVVEPLAH